MCSRSRDSIATYQLNFLITKRASCLLSLCFPFSHLSLSPFSPSRSPCPFFRSFLRRALHVFEGLIPGLKLRGTRAALTSLESAGRRDSAAPSAQTGRVSLQQGVVGSEKKMGNAKERRKIAANEPRVPSRANLWRKCSNSHTGPATPRRASSSASRAQNAPRHQTGINTFTPARTNGGSHLDVLSSDVYHQWLTLRYVYHSKYVVR